MRDIQSNVMHRGYDDDAPSLSFVLHRAIAQEFH